VDDADSKAFCLEQLGKLDEALAARA
jgi:hypothetical protein